ncbi:anaerobic C4-dicarboxylate transporter family protein [Klebsiella pneumoniae]|nr:anaerobic C4-dicarboxylate transporter family protein [Klebsiella pneumoniae]
MVLLKYNIQYQLVKKQGRHICFWWQNWLLSAGDLSSAPGSAASVSALFRWPWRPCPERLFFKLNRVRSPSTLLKSIKAVLPLSRHAGRRGWITGSLAETLLRRPPEVHYFLAPLVAWFMTRVAGHRPYRLSSCGDHRKLPRARHSSSRPLSIAVVASQIGDHPASPISAAVVFSLVS